MLTFRHDKGTFNYRAVGVLIDGGRLLLHRAEEDNFWTLPGGRVEFGEPAGDALARELAEELDTPANVERLLWVVENFFTYRGAQFHELAFYFLVTLPEGSPLSSRREPFKGFDDGVPLIFRWHPVEDLKDLTLYPTFLREALRDIPRTIEYVVHRDEDDKPDAQL